MRHSAHTALSSFVVPVENTYRPDPDDPAIQDFAGYGLDPVDVANTLELSCHDIVLRTGKQPVIATLIESLHEVIQDSVTADDKRRAMNAAKKARRNA